MNKLPIVALIGQTNAGKSSILNRLAHKNIAIVAREEGTTRDNVVTKIDDRFKTMINVGSVGQPRDKDPRSCVVFYEMEAKELWMDRVEYDIEAARAKIMDAKLPQKFADRLLVGA